MRINERNDGITQHDTASEAVADAKDRAQLRELLDKLDLDSVDSYIVMFKVKPGTIENSPQADCISARAGNMADLYQMSQHLTHEMMLERTQLLASGALNPHDGEPEQ